MKIKGLALLSPFLLIAFGLILYIPFLGLKEFQGEEGRRVLYALSMLESGEFLLPTLFGEPYYNKPPLFNWVLALAFYLTKEPSEFVARTVSVISVIATALFLSLIWKSLLKEKTIYRVLLPGLIYLTIPEVIDKALRAEIDAFYSFLVSLSLYVWFYLHQVKKRPRLAYLMAGLFGGLAVLTKTFQALLFFYLATIPFLFTQGKRGEFLSIRHLLFFIGPSVVLLAWLLPLSLKGDVSSVFRTWLAEYLSSAQAKEMSPFNHFQAYTIGAVISLSPWIFIFGLVLRNPPKRDPMLYALYKFSLGLFTCTYLFHLLFPGARFRYILPSLSGFTFLCALPFLTQEKILRLSSKWVFIVAVTIVFLGKELFTFLYYPYHVKRMNYFRRGALELATHLTPDKTLYLCQVKPHHLLYYLRYRFKAVDRIFFLKDCQDLPKGAVALIEERRSRTILHPANWELIPFKVRSKDYFIIKVK